jgi:hypothetical protein
LGGVPHYWGGGAISERNNMKIFTQSSTPSTAYVRTRQIGDDTLVMETKTKHFRPAKGSGPAVSLVGVVHIGDAVYYKQLQAFLDKQNVVLFERVKPPKQPLATPTPAPISATPTTSPTPRPPASMQKRLAETLGLTFQLTEIQYNRPFFVNSDLSFDDLKTLAAQGGKATEEQLNGLVGMLSGQGFMGELMNGMMDRMDKNPRQKRYFKRFLMQTLTTQGLMESALGKAKPGEMSMQDLIIVERNKAVMKDLQTTIATKKPRTIAIFYGAGHMEDMEKRLITEMAYKPAEERWFTAIVDKK